jgi:hypothetical protein
MGGYLMLGLILPHVVRGDDTEGAYVFARGLAVNPGGLA